jgi:carbon storage regulator
MLVLSRKSGEKVVIGGSITITVLRVSSGSIRLGLEAPDHVEIVRGELADREHAPAPRRPVKGRP